MPGNKHRTKRRLKRRPPTQGEKKTSDAASMPAVSTLSASAAATTTPTTSTVTAATAPAVAQTASQKKLCKSTYFHDTDVSDSSDSDSDIESYEGKGMRLFEVAGLQAALQSVCCKECGGGPIVLREDFSKRQGFCT